VPFSSRPRSNWPSSPPPGVSGRHPDPLARISGPPRPAQWQGPPRAPPLGRYTRPWRSGPRNARRRRPRPSDRREPAR